MRVLVAMSGGVDSSVAALRLQQQGHEVLGVFLRNGVTGPGAAGPAATAAIPASPSVATPRAATPRAASLKVASPTAASRTCCSASDSRDAAAVCDRLGIPFYSLDYAAEFGAIMDHFAAEYRRGRTPNPCVLCNQQLKFGHVLQLMDDLAVDAVATGHYARIVDGRLLKARDAQKDQTYYLFGLDPAVLPRVLFPLGDLDKAEVRAIARDHGLGTADKQESMEICFVTSGDYRDFVRQRGGGGRPGRFVDRAGKLLGRHDGIDGFTVGQRRGLPALGVPHYVVAIDPDSGDVTLSPRDGLAASQAEVSGLHWLSGAPAPGERVAVHAKVRARSPEVPATVEVAGDGAARVHFAAPVEAITPGQAAVFYRGEQVLGGAWID